MNLKHLPGHLARRLHQISTTLFDVEMSRAGLILTPVQFAALVALRDRPDVDQATLAATIAYDRTTIGGVIDRLAENGMVERYTDPSDRRCKRLKLTPAGHDALALAEPLASRSQQELVSSLSPAEQEHLVGLMQKVVDALGDKSRTPREL
ncbi:MarR family winged helix-turn-helix transcriptional regulator [Devosia submarina]|uniref:MarR family winged helix-turn-helix transcriptional regulator n=1 Tax=Devosia submarina TaxID=1173082 RepID=UPI001AECDAB4|nr:MarR family transcriptional regulator [Devosia submarina]